uniref:Uncharacterized protein n=1 Tax=Meloidogyne enterolobii TaxID=390850 RepID=A0A6V7X0P9_MELEN|nr:unnamed protein product [Meloidogyne enterolobii]
MLEKLIKLLIIFCVCGCLCDEIKEKILIKLNTQIEIQEEFISNFKILAYDFFDERKIAPEKLELYSQLFPVEAFINLNKINKDPENLRQKIIIGCWEVLIKQSKQFINLLKWGSVEELENIAGSSDNKQISKPLYNFNNLFDLKHFEEWYTFAIGWELVNSYLFDKTNFYQAKIFGEKGQININNKNNPLFIRNYFSNFLERRREVYINLINFREKILLKDESDIDKLNELENIKIYIYKVFIKAYLLKELFNYVSETLYGESFKYLSRVSF